jgi:hypothetical protein
MEILPFNSTQIQSMLKKQLGEQDSALVFKFISNNHYLSGLASRPFLLNKIAEIKYFPLKSLNLLFAILWLIFEQ